LMLCGHSDTKPVGDASQWQTDPLEPVFKDGKLYGLGSTDMKGAVAAMIYATAAIQQSEVVLAGDLLLVINADEERSMKFGSEFLATDYGIQADVALLGEPSGIDGPEFEFLHLVSRGVCCFKIRVLGTQMHSSLTDRLSSVNANVKLADVLARMNRELRLTYLPHTLCANPTINLAVKIEGGVGYGVCPGVAEFQADIRTLPGMTRQQLQLDVERCLDSIRRDDPELRVELEFEQPPLDWIPATEVPADHPLVAALFTASEEVLGWRPKLSAFPGATDAAKFQALAGIPTIPSFGPGWLKLAHGPNECVGMEAIVQAAKIYALAARAYLR
ncbi:MAG: M20/M25/M40 family metallo-hydrolase, partial [Pirellulaceae bacterium]|nr:M20/M25/M40 family metallo-hydrolase [Pirellulaceae bacterium]